MSASKSVPARWIPKGSHKLASKKSAAVAYLYGSAERPCAVCYMGQSAKPAMNYRFPSPARRLARVGEWLRGCDESAAYRAKRVAERKAKLAAPHTLQAGDVLSGQWGYDQTNVEFWEVTKLVGKRMVEIRELCCERLETGFMQGEAVPLPGQYTSKAAERKVVNESGSVKLFSWGCYLSKVEPIKVDGKAVGYRPAHWTAYA